MFIRVTGTGREKFARMKSTPSIRTARKQRLGQGNVFTGVRLSTGAGRGFRACITGHMTRGGPHPVGGVCVCLGGMDKPPPPPPTRTRKARSTHPTEILSWEIVILPPANEVAGK